MAAAVVRFRRRRSPEHPQHGGECAVRFRRRRSTHGRTFMPGRSSIQAAAMAEWRRQGTGRSGRTRGGRDGGASDAAAGGGRGPDRARSGSKGRSEAS